ncbi:hypothetical protein [Immundisolibacter sp.]
MNPVTYPSCIRELYESEIFGEASALALIKAAKNDHDRYRFGTLLQLETETKARLRPFLAKYGLPLTEDMDLSDVDGMVGAYKATSNFREFATAIIPAIEHFHSRFAQIAQAGPADDQPVLESMVRHESAILSWLVQESDGLAEGALDSMIGELKHPLPKGA